MSKMWLNNNEETEFKFNPDEELLNIFQDIKIDNQIIEECLQKRRVEGLSELEEDEILLGGVSAVCLEKEQGRKEFAPYSEIQDANVAEIADGFVKAQELMLMQLKKEPYLYVEMLAPIHRVLCRDNLDLNDFEKGRMRDRYSNAIMTGYFEPTEGSKVGSEMSIAFTKYAYVDRKGLDNPFEKTAKLHAQIVRIQPFMDGNKRMAFLLTNAMLKLHKLPIIDLCKNEEESEEYYSALKTAIVKRDVTPLAKIIALKVRQRQEQIKDKITIDNVKQITSKKESDQSISK